MIYPSLALLLLYSWCLFVLDTRPQQTLDYESKLWRRIFLFCANLFFYLCTFLCLAGQKNHLRQEVLFVQTAAFREAVREGGFERKAPIKEKPQLFLKTTTNIGCKI